MPHPIDLDHVAIGVRSVQPYLDRFVREYRANHIGGGQVPGFRAVQIQLGSAGMTLELLEPFLTEKNDFLQRFVDRLGEGPHHLTFKVPDLASRIDELRGHGLDPVQINLTNPVWKECFLMPHQAHGTVVQVAQSDFDDPEAYAKLEQHGLGWGTDWWRDAGRPAGPELTLHAVCVTSQDVTATAGFFETVLGGRPSPGDAGSVRLAWPGGGAVVVEPGERPGIHHFEVSGIPTSTIGGTLFKAG